LEKWITMTSEGDAERMLLKLVRAEDLYEKTKET
jgi:hypothetical protein